MQLIWFRVSQDLLCEFPCVKVRSLRFLHVDTANTIPRYLIVQLLPNRDARAFCS